MVQIYSENIANFPTILLEPNDVSSRVICQKSNDQKPHFLRRISESFLLKYRTRISLKGKSRLGNCFFTMFLLNLLCFVMFPLAGFSEGEHEIELDRSYLHTGYRVEDPVFQTFVISITDVLGLAMEKDIFQRSITSDKVPNFYFFSGLNYIKDGKVNADALSFLPAEFTPHLNTMQTSASRCYITSVVFNQRVKTLFVVNNTNKEADYGDTQCFLVGLYTFFDLETEKLLKEQWQDSVARLLLHLKGNTNG